MMLRASSGCPSPSSAPVMLRRRRGSRDPFRSRCGGRRVHSRALASGNSSSEGASREGNKQIQDMLADMVRLQTGRAQVEGFVADKAEELTAIADGAKDEFQKIADGAAQSMEAANARILQELDSQVEDLEKELAAAREEARKRDEEFEEFEKALAEKQNAGLFFKSLYKKGSKREGETPPSLEEVMKSNPELAASTKKAASSMGRRSVYGVFALLAALTLANAIADSASLTTILVCAGILVALVFQVVYELSLSE